MSILFVHFSSLVRTTSMIMTLMMESSNELYKSASQKSLIMKSSEEEKTMSMPVKMIVKFVP